MSTNGSELIFVYFFITLPFLKYISTQLNDHTIISVSQNFNVVNGATQLFLFGQSSVNDNTITTFELSRLQRIILVTFVLLNYNSGIGRCSTNNATNVHSAMPWRSPPDQTLMFRAIQKSRRQTGMFFILTSTKNLRQLQSAHVFVGRQRLLLRNHITDNITSLLFLLGYNFIPRLIYSIAICPGGCRHVGCIFETTFNF
mmetsp:Transcript_15479/g.31989  ORF Transcript_15479/g.31989 Transcript_15479/m.31989 type:complete len:200 (+) Transcript_15479:1906-2505(+)